MSTQRNAANGPHGAQGGPENKAPGGRGFPLREVGGLLVLLGFVQTLFHRKPENPTTQAELGASAAPFLIFVVCLVAGGTLFVVGCFRKRSSS
jgi:hypothetical protein